MLIKQNMKYFLILALVLTGCKSSTLSEIIGVWDFSFVKDNITVSGLTSFTDDEQNVFTIRGEISTTESSCQFITTGNFLIAENKTLTLIYDKIRITQSNSSYLKEKVIKMYAEDRFGKKSYSHKIMNLNSETLITNDMSSITSYVKNKLYNGSDEIFDLFVNKEEEFMFYNLDCYVGAEFEFIKNEYESAAIIRDAGFIWRTTLSNGELIANIVHESDDKTVLGYTTRIVCGNPDATDWRGNRVYPEIEPLAENEEAFNYDDFYLIVDKETYSKMMEKYVLTK